MSVEDRETLRDFQGRLEEKLKAAQVTSGASSKLGILAGGGHWLVSLDQINEVVTVPQLTEVAWSQPWFAGVAGVRGVIYGCVDLGAFAGMAEPIPKGEARLLLVHPRFGVNTALRVERALGLRPVKELTPEPDEADAPSWVLGRWRGADGEIWVEISVEKLVSMPTFLEAGV